MEKNRDQKKLKEILTPMSRKEKLSYLWTYYKWVPVTAVLVIAVLCSVIGIVSERRSETVLSGIIVNVPVTAGGEKYLTEQLLTELGGTPEEQHMELQSIFFQDLLTTDDPSVDQATAMKVTARVTTRSLDYVIMDEVGFGYYQNQDVFSPVDTVLTERQLSQWADRLVYHEGEPIALELTDTAFVTACMSAGGSVYLAFPGNTGNNDLCAEFAQRLLSWRE